MNQSEKRYELVKGEEIVVSTDMYSNDVISNEVLLNCPAEGLDLCIYKKNSEFSKDMNLDQVNYLVMETKVNEENSMCFQINFYRSTPEKGKEADFRMIFGLLPNVFLTVPIDLNLIDSQQIFPKRTMGRLKMTVFGKPIRKEEIEEIHVTTMPYIKDHSITIRKLYLAEAAPKITLENVKLMDELGQWIPKTWDTKVNGRLNLNSFLHKLLEKANSFDFKYPYANWDEYGGWTERQFTKTGWFHTEFDGERWWLVDPIGNVFLSTGIDCLVPGTDTRIDIIRPWCSFLPETDSEFFDAIESKERFDEPMDFYNYGISNLIAAYGNETWWENWAKILKMYLYQWGINTIGNWSDIRFIKYAKMPYVLPLDVYSTNGYPTTNHKIFRDFPDVFAKEYKDAAMDYAKALLEFKDDPFLIGYFMRNEPAWAFVYDLNIAEEMLANPVITESKKEFVRRMEVKYKSVDTMNTAWKLELISFEELYKSIYHSSNLSEQAKKDLEEFSREMITLYVEIPAKACKEIDKKHLNMGMRYAYITDTSLLCGYENFDVFSINSYHISPFAEVEKIGTLLNMPVVVGEFHHGALDKGLTAHGIKGVLNQEERGKAYRYYVEQGALSKFFLGAHYFQLNDQSCLGRFDGENYQIGILDICMQEYSEMVEAMKKCHSQIYQVAYGSKMASDTLPEYVPPIHY
ncbi:MAG: hypothetical protein K0S41_1733 [Anaerocolumna sp.]|jgi:hypothetical protein|nr:hypothetical protein [Anaerocolumna sp.]